jgi:hypothetical protein
VKLTELAPPEPPSRYADEGTKAHGFLEHFLKSGGTYGASRSRADTEMVGHAAEAFEIIARKAGGADILSETRVSLEFIAPKMFGTCDAAIVKLFDTLTVIDYKYGAGYAVDVKDNSQLIYYALGLAHAYGYLFEKVELMIIQPRAFHAEGPVRSHTMTIDELCDWSVKFQEGVARCESPYAEYSAGEHCRFCPAKTICPEISDMAFKQARIDFAPIAKPEKALALPDSGYMDEVSRLGKILDAAPKIETWLESVREHAFNTLKNGAKIPGWKLVPKQSRRQWASPTISASQARERWGEKAFSSPELLSPSQLEKQVGKSAKEWIESQVTSVSSGLTMVPESDKRSATASAIEDIKELSVKTETPKKKKEENK